MRAFCLLVIPFAVFFLLVSSARADPDVLVNVSIASDKQQIKVTLENYEDSDQNCIVNIRAIAGTDNQDITTLLLSPRFDVPAGKSQTFLFGRDQLDHSILGIGYKSAEARSQTCSRIPVSTFVKELAIPGQSVIFVDLLEQADSAVVTLTWQSGGCVGAGVSPQGFAVQKFDRAGRFIWRAELCNFSGEENQPAAKLVPTAGGGVTLVTVRGASAGAASNTLQKLDISVTGQVGRVQEIAKDLPEITNLYASGEIGRFRAANMHENCAHAMCFDSTVYGIDGTKGPKVELEYRILPQNGLPDLPFLSAAKAIPLNDGSFLAGGKAPNVETYYMKRHAADGSLIWAREVKYPPGVGPFARYGALITAIVRNDGQIHAILLGENTASHQVTPMLFLLDPTDGHTVWASDFNFDFKDSYLESASFFKNGDVLLAGSMGSRALLMRTDPNANILWTRTISASDNVELTFWDCREARDGGILCDGVHGKKAVLYKLTAEGKDGQ